MIITIDGNIPSQFAHSFNVMKMAQGFHEAGEEVSLVSLLSLPNIRERIRIGDLYDHYGVAKNIQIKFLPVYNFDFFTKRTEAKDFSIIAAKYIKKRNPDFVYCRSYLTPYYCSRMGVPSILETHTTVYNLPALQKIYEICHDRNFLGIVTISEDIKKAHIDRGVPADKIIALEDGVDLKRFNIDDDKFCWREKCGLPLDKRIVMYCGSLYKEKGIEDILLSAKKLMSHDKLLYVIIGGTDEQLAEWKDYIKNRDIDNVKFFGFIKNIDIPKYLKSADVLIMPYNLKVHYRVMDVKTTSPMKLFEYMASKRPIITSDIPAISKIVEHQKSALLAEPNNVDQIVRFILELLGDRKKSMQISTNAFEAVKKYEWKNRCERILDKFVRSS